MRVPRSVIQWLEDHRGLVIVLFCLPASFVFDVVCKVLQLIKHHILFSASTTHFERVEHVQKQVKLWNQLPKDQRKYMCTARPNWLSLSTTFVQKSKMHKISVDLDKILHLDEELMTVHLEPMVTVRDATKFLVPKGYTLACTLEIGDATVGGLAMGAGMTTYSHKVGFFQETIISYEVILADGTHAHVEKDNEYQDLFMCLPWSHGSLGLLVGLEVQIVHAKPYVLLQYMPVHGQKNFCDKMRELSGALDKNAETADFLEATIFSQESAVLTVGNFATIEQDKDHKKVVLTMILISLYKPRVSALIRFTGEEYIPLEEYLLRHNRAIFWVLESMIPFGNHPLFRFFLGWLCPPKPAFLKFTTTPKIRALTFTKQVFQDFVLPMAVMEESLNIASELFDTFPLLIYPCRIYDHGKESGQLRSPKPEQRVPEAGYSMFYDLGVYGTPGAVRRKEKYDCVYAMRTMEKFTRENGGYSFLYADIFMTREEFKEMFDLTLYRKVREKYKATDAFPDVFDKVKPEVDVFKIGKEYANVF